jgi:2-polyprenyl-3-methyl-5-hydroxy-6-metoxy-1,4-benzoquinol methylase
MKIDYERYWKDRIKKNKMPMMPRHREIVKIITSSRSSGKILDLGCGEGHILNILPDSLKKYGCDISELPLKFLDDNVTAKTCDLNKEFPFDDVFDVIVCSEVLEHLENPERLLQNISNHIKQVD